MKRGQITLLVIIGIILLFSVSMLLFLGRTTYNERLQSQAEASVNEFIESNSISQYVTSCLQRVASQGIVTLASQGGVIYDYQGGLTPTTGQFQVGTQFLTYQESQESYNISYALIPVDQNYCYHYFPQGPFDPSHPYYEQRWKYPVEELGLADFVTRFLSTVEPGCDSATAPKDIRKSGYLGYSKFPFLCTPESGADYASTPNFLGIPLTCPERYWSSSTINYALENPPVESQLENFVKTNLINCFDVSLYESKGDEVTLDMDKTNISVFFMEPGGILISADFPFEIAIEGGAPIIELVHFEQTLDFNFLDTYNFLFELTSAMALDPFFDYKQYDYQNLPSYKTTFNLEYIEGDCEDCNVLPSSLLYDDVLIVTDVSTQLSGDFVPFQLAFRQRKPVLDYMANPEQNFIYTPVDGEPINVDFLFYQRELMEFEPRAIDPNYDDINITVSGWKETTDNLLDLACCADDETCTLNNYEQCSLNTQNYPNLNLTCCRGLYPEDCNKEIIDEVIALNYPHTCLETEPFEPHILSQNMEANDGSISYIIEDTDLGFHTIRFEVIDEHGFMDYQDVTVIVYDSPIAVLQPENWYPDINNLFASVEDPYWLYANASLASVFSQEQELSFFVYRIPYENDFVNKTPNSTLELPVQEYGIENITPLIFNKTNFLNSRLPTEDNILVDIHLRVEQDIQGELTDSPESVTEITLSECLPHGFFNSGGSAGYGPYSALEYYDISIYEADGEPYYSTYLDPDATLEEKFQLPHVCCIPQTIPTPSQPGQQLDGGTIADENIICYDNPTYQTCYPPASGLTGAINTGAIDIELFLSNPAIDDDGELLPLNAENYLNAFGVQMPSVSPPGDNPYIGSALFGDAINDIYFLSQRQYCSGERGNTCSGQLELSWDYSATIECEDFSSTIPGQYARCEGPGLPADAASDPNFVDNDNVNGGSWGNPDTSYYFEYAFDDDVGGYSCQGDDATYYYNVTLTCNPYQAGHSFEKDMLKVSSFNQYHLSNNVANWIGRGYCAGPRPSSVISFGSSVASASGPFECFATCGGSTGCGYDTTESVRTCTCDVGNSCDDLRATSLLGGTGGFACNGNVPCNGACQPIANNKDQCYCQINPFSRGGTSYSNFAAFFGDKDLSIWELSQPTAACCSAPGDFAVITADGASEPGASVCFNGQVVPATTQSLNNVFGLNAPGDRKLLSFEGKVYYCAHQNVCVSDDTTVPALTNGLYQCLSNSQNSPGCSYQYNVANAACCAIDSGSQCNDAVAFCTTNPDATCCVDDPTTCVQGNIECTSPLTLNPSCVSQVLTSDPLQHVELTSLGVADYVEEAVNVGDSRGGKTCGTTGWS